MKRFLKNSIWPILAGLVSALLIMMIFEFVNAFVYPIPKNLDMSDTRALQAFTATLPWTAFILVFIGWVVGSFVSGFVVTLISKEKTYALSLVVGIILTIFGIFNNLLIGHSFLFNVFALPMFILFTYIGHRYYWRRKN
jgi:hypothetical protein